MGNFKPLKGTRISFFVSRSPLKGTNSKTKLVPTRTIFPVYLTGINLTVLILDLNTLSGLAVPNHEILTPKRYDVHPCHFHMGVTAVEI